MVVMMQERPKIGIAVLVFKEGKVLLGRRSGSSPGSGMYAAPGGHLEQGESFIDCVRREIAEETGLAIEGMRLLCATNVRCFPPAHYVLLSVAADWKSGEPQNCEPDRCEGWEWHDLQELPSPLTPATQSGIEAFRGQGMLFESTQESPQPFSVE